MSIVRAASAVKPDQLESSRRLGQLEAEEFDARLREDEGRDWGRNFARFPSGTDDRPESAAVSDDGSPEVLRLQREMEHLAAFHRAVLNSRAWRMIQAIRRVFGRDW